MLKLILLGLMLAHAAIPQEPELSEAAKNLGEQLAQERLATIKEIEANISKLRKAKGDKTQIAKLKQQVEKLKADDAFYPDNFDLVQIKAGSIGRFTETMQIGNKLMGGTPSFSIIQIIDKKTFIASLGQTVVIIKGLPTENLTTETKVPIGAVFQAKKTETYTTIGGEERTVWVFEKFTEYDAAVAYAQKLLKKKK
jgi:chorismate-pyruvate lyase